jgi:hypothetical protein
VSVSRCPPGVLMRILQFHNYHQQPGGEQAVACGGVELDHEPQYGRSAVKIVRRMGDSGRNSFLLDQNRRLGDGQILRQCRLRPCQILH